MDDKTMDWAEAKRHFDEVKAQYLEIPAASAMPALMITFGPLQRRYESGERTRELYDAMMAVE